MTKTVFITGASRGIGRACALAFGKAGWNVAINFLQNQEKAQSLLEELLDSGAQAALFQADVSQQAEIQNALQQATKTFGQIDALVNNAGIAKQQLFSDVTLEDWRQIFQVNVEGVFHTCQAVLPQMIHRKEGRIINLSSIWGITGGSCEVSYSASKAAVIGLTKALAKELGPSGITVNCVAPGVIDTEMNGNLDQEALEMLKEETPLGVIGKPQDVAELVLFLATEKAGFLTGQVISPNGGILI